VHKKDSSSEGSGSDEEWNMLFWLSMNKINHFFSLINYIVE
jgi:hypothetical protein